jgi:chemotaxis protein MotB
MKKRNESPGNHERWLLTYSDLITLLMIFFVIMYAMSNVDLAKYQQMAESLRISMGNGKSIIGNQNASNITQKPKAIKAEIQPGSEQQKLEQLKKQVDKYLSDNGMSQSVSTQIDERGLVVSLKDSLLFDSGKAEIKPEFQKKIIQIGKILNGLGNYMRIEGHTDNVPISNSEFSSNWQLSCARAANVTEFFIANCGIQPQKLSAVGYGEYRPVADNSTEEGRAKNRRVDIIIVNTKFNNIEGVKAQNNTK